MPELPVIYLASPYTHPDETIREERFNQACQAAAKLITHGFVVYSPIAHSHAIAKQGNLPVDWATWERQCLGMLDLCEMMVVLMLDGWDQSNGIRNEQQHCVDRGIPYVEVAVNDLDLFSDRLKASLGG